MIKKLRQFKPFRVFIWNLFNASVTLLTTILLMQTDEKFVAIAPLLMSVLSFLTKYLNTRYFNDLGTDAK